jgi:hypothetical protein
MVTPEGSIKAQVKAMLKLAGWYEFTVSQFNKKGYKVHSGISDLIAIKGGRVLFLEIKTATGNQRPAQAEFEREVREHGGEYHIIRSVDELLTVIGG